MSMIKPNNTTWYLAGPMTGMPYLNFPVFDEVANNLRAAGYDVVSPAELDSRKAREAALQNIHGDMELHGKITGEGWGDCLARDVKLIADRVDAIVTMAGWEKSKGAKLEVYVGLISHKPIYAYTPTTDSLMTPIDFLTAVNIVTPKAA